MSNDFSKYMLLRWTDAVLGKLTILLAWIVYLKFGGKRACNIIQIENYNVWLKILHKLHDLFWFFSSTKLVDINVE